MMNENLYLYLYCDKSNPHFIVWTPSSDGANLPSSYDWRLRRIQPVPIEPFRHGPELKRIVDAINFDGLMMVE
jgi:hypothetical protein